MRLGWPSGVLAQVDRGNWNHAAVVGLRRRAELDGCEHTERRMATLAVVKNLEVLKHRVGEVNASAPPLSVEQLDLHPTPIGLHHGVVENSRRPSPSMAEVPSRRLDE